MIHANRQQGSRRTIDLSVRSDPNPRISEWPMPGTDMSKAFSGCLQNKTIKFVMIFVIYLLTNVITYQFSHTVCGKHKTCLHVFASVHLYELKRPSMSKTVAAATISTQCGFTNGAG